MNAGYFYCPYIPLQETPVVTALDLKQEATKFVVQPGSIIEIATEDGARKLVVEQPFEAQASETVTIKASEYDAADFSEI